MYYGEKLKEIPVKFQGDWELEYYDVPDYEIITGFFMQLPAAKGKTLTIKADSMTFEKDECKFKRVYTRNPKITFFDFIIDEEDAREYSNYFQNSFFKKACLKKNNESYSIKEARKASESGLVVDCKKNSGLFFPSDMVLLSDNEMFAAVQDHFVCYRRKH